jgi:hypothetical protein
LPFLQASFANVNLMKTKFWGKCQQKNVRSHSDQLTNETKVKPLFYLAIEGIRRYQIFQADSSEWPEIPDFVTEHAARRSPCSAERTSDAQSYSQNLSAC